MPSAPDELQDLATLIWGDMDISGPLRFLEERGFKDDNGFIRPPTADHHLTWKEGIAVDFLFMEWDFAYGDPKPVTEAGAYRELETIESELGKRQLDILDGRLRLGDGEKIQAAQVIASCRIAIAALRKERDWFQELLTERTATLATAEAAVREAPADAVEKARQALTKIKKLRSEPIGNTGFAVGPKALLDQAQRIAREALKALTGEKEGRTPDV